MQKKTCKKEPITPDILQKLYDMFVTSDADLSIICTIATCLQGFAGFFRFSGLVTLKEYDTSFYESHMETFVEDWPV